MKTVNRQILAIALPAIVSNITTPVLGLVDVAIVGHIGAADYIGAVAVGTAMFNMIYWIFGFLRMGTAGLTSQAYGANDAKAIAATLGRSMLLAVVFATTLMLLSYPICKGALLFFEANADIARIAQTYFLIGILGAIPSLGMFALNGWFLGMQNTRIPMYVALLTNIVNIMTSITLVFGLGMRIEGVAVGTITAQWLGFIVALVVLYRKYHIPWPHLSDLLIRSEMVRFFKVNFDIFLRTLCLVIVTVWFTRAGSLLSEEILAANALLMQLFMLFSYFSDGLAFAGEALSGKNYGARDFDGLRRVVSALMRGGALIAVVFTLLYFFGGNLFLTMLTNDATVIDVAQTYLPWAVCVPACGIVAFMYDGVCIGLTYTRLMLYSIAGATAAYFILYYALTPSLANHALWIAYLSYLFIRGLYLHFALRSKLKRLS